MTEMQYTKDAKHPQQRLIPTASASGAFQSDSTNTADAHEKWLDVTQGPNMWQHRDKLHKRFDQAVTPSRLLDSSLHPDYRSCYWIEILILSQSYWNLRLSLKNVAQVYSQ